MELGRVCGSDLPASTGTGSLSQSALCQDSTFANLRPAGNSTTTEQHHEPTGSVLLMIACPIQGRVVRVTNQIPAFELWDSDVTTWPRSVLKWVLFREGVGPGSRILEIRAEDTGFPAFARQLGIDVDTRTPFQVENDSESGTDDDLESWTSRYDLILVRHHPLVHQPLHTSHAVDSSSRLVSELVPGGSLIVHIASSLAEPTHDVECWKSHLRLFPGVVESRAFGGRWNFWGRSGSSGHPSSGSVWSMASLTSQPLPQSSDDSNQAGLFDAASVTQWECQCLKAYDEQQPARSAA